MANEQIRAAAREAGIRLWEVAEYCGVTDSTFSRKLRHELPSDQTAHILNAIESMAARKQAQAQNFLEIHNEGLEV